jgi:muramoyltetrapeptide carboxypeptidase LdcA involved in peptidoglycan recycling
MKKPRRLAPGSRIAAISLSWGGPATFPHRYQAGKRQLEAEFGVTVVESKYALRDAAWLSKNPEARAADLMAAFEDPGIDGIISTIGGDDSIRILPHLDLKVIRNNPKVFMGYSDTSISLAACYKAGLVSFNGPAIMAGFGENAGMFPYMVDSVRKTLFRAEPIGILEPNRDGWTVEFLDWGKPETQNVRRKLNPCASWRFHQEGGRVEGRLFGGCLEVLDWLRGSEYFPSAQDLDGAILFLETSEEAPPPHMVKRFLRSLAAMGILHRLKGILLGRPGGVMDPSKFVEYEEALARTVREEYGLKDLALVTGMDFGHTDPMLVIPLGLTLILDSALRRISIAESAVI